MFRTTESKEPVPAKTDTGSIIAKGMRLTGEFVGEGNVLLEGQYNGSIRCQTLTIGKSGHMDGQVRAEKVIIHGTFSGDIQAKQVVFHTTAHVTGDVSHEILEVEAGAKVEGRYTRKKQGKPQVTTKLMDTQKERPPAPSPLTKQPAQPSADTAVSGGTPRPRDGNGRKLPAAE